MLNNETSVVNNEISVANIVPSGKISTIPELVQVYENISSYTHKKEMKLNIERKLKLIQYTKA